jgi:hypothetical protein
MSSLPSREQYREYVDDQLDSLENDVKQLSDLVLDYVDAGDGF